MLYVDATCINYDGNAFDATLIAMVAALKNSLFPLPLFPPQADVVQARLPKASFDEEANTTICSRKVMTPLHVARSPISLSFGIFDSYADLYLYPSIPKLLRR